MNGFGRLWLIFKRMYPFFYTLGLCLAFRGLNYYGLGILPHLGMIMSSWWLSELRLLSSWSWAFYYFFCCVVCVSCVLFDLCLGLSGIILSNYSLVSMSLSVNLMKDCLLEAIYSKKKEVNYKWNFINWLLSILIYSDRH